MTEEKPRRQPVNVVGPILLIGLGLLLLLNNMGYIDWSVWDALIRLWPVLLIAWGIELIFAPRGTLGALLSAALLILVLGGVIWTAMTAPEPRADAIEIVETREGVEEAQIILSFNVGELDVGALRDASNLIEGEIFMDSDEELKQEFTVDDGEATLLLENESRFVPGIHLGPKRRWDLNLHPGVALDLDVDFGIGDAYLDLADLDVENVSVDFGIGKATVILPEEIESNIDVNLGIGEVIVEIPEGLPVRIHLETGIAGRRVPAEYRQRDNVYTSPGYEEGEGSEIYIDLGIGNVTIRQIGE